MLATRDSGWCQSDPRRLEDWYRSAIKEHGESLRRVSRYFKGWRDYQWEDGGPSSIALMASIVSVFDEIDGHPPSDRDDLAVQAVANRLPHIFLGSISNPALPHLNLDENWSAEDRDEFVAHATDLKSTIDLVLNGTYHKQVALSHLESEFGERIPNDEQLIQIATKEKDVLRHAPTKTRAPVVPRTTSG